MKYLKKLKLIVIAFAFSILLVMKAFAGTGVIQFGDPTVTRDKTFSLSMKVKSTDVRLKTADITIEYDANMIEFLEGTNAEGGAGTVRINGTGEGKSSGTRTLAYQIKFKALYAGVTNVTILDQEVSDTTDNLVNVTKLGSSKITIKPSNTQSKNANLTTLEFSPGEFNRDFDPSILTYNTEVNADVDSMVISAIPEDKDAKVVITGNENFVTGINKVNITVTAPDNQTAKTYVLNVTKLETGVTNGDTTITNGQRLSSNKYTVTIMIRPEDVPIPSGYKKLEGNFGGNTIETYGPVDTPDGETPETFLIYGMNEKGKIDFYRYDRREDDNTLQRYVLEPNAGNYEIANRNYESVKKKYNELVKKWNILFPVAGVFLGLILLLIIILIVVIVKSGSKNSKKRPSYGDDIDDDDDDYYINNRPNSIKSSVKDNIDDDFDVSDKIKDYDTNSSNDDIEDLG